MARLKEEIDSLGTSPVFVHMGSEEQAAKMFTREGGERMADAPRVSDPDRKLYGAFGLGKGSLTQLMGPATIAVGFKAFVSGFRPGKPVGDMAQMGGIFLIRDGEVLREHRPRTNGEQPDYLALARPPDS